ARNRSPGVLSGREWVGERGRAVVVAVTGLRMSREPACDVACIPGTNSRALRLQHPAASPARSKTFNAIMTNNLSLAGCCINMLYQQPTADRPSDPGESRSCVF